MSGEYADRDFLIGMDMMDNGYPDDRESGPPRQMGGARWVELHGMMTVETDKAFGVLHDDETVWVPKSQWLSSRYADGDQGRYVFVFKEITHVLATTWFARKLERIQ